MYGRGEEEKQKRLIPELQRRQKSARLARG
jgi:hypothetical protein